VGTGGANLGGVYEHRDDPSSLTDADATRRRRIRWGLLAAVAVVLVAAIPGIALNSDSGTKQVSSGELSAPATTSTTTGIGVVAGVPMGPVPNLTTTTAPGTVTPLQTGATVPPAAPTTTSAPASAPPPPARAPCHNSYDPACGPFHWDTDSGPNAPLTVTVTTQQVNGTESVNFHIVAHDPDAKVDRCAFFIDFGDGHSGSTCPPPPTCQTPYGPWTPPAKVDDQQEFDVPNAPHTYPGPGTYQASVVVQSHSFCNPDPYGGSAQSPVQVTVS